MSVKPVTMGLRSTWDWESIAGFLHTPVVLYSTYNNALRMGFEEESINQAKHAGLDFKTAARVF